MNLHLLIKYLYLNYISYNKKKKDTYVIKPEPYTKLFLSYHETISKLTRPITVIIDITIRKQQ